MEEIEVLTKKNSFFAFRKSERPTNTSEKPDCKTPNEKKNPTTDTQRFRRLLNIIRLSEGNRPRIQDLAEICKSSTRTIYRDIDKLRELGIVISVHPGTHHISVSEPVYLPAISFTTEEAFALFTICYEAAREPAFPMLEAVGEATGKLYRALPPSIVNRARPMCEKVQILKTPVHPHKDSKPIFNTICEAMLHKTAVEIDYQSSGDCKVITSTFHPYQLMFAKYAWYVIGWAEAGREIKRFHVGRIKDIRMTEMKFVQKKTFSLERYLRNAWCIAPETGPDHQVEIRFSANVAQKVSEILWHKTQKTTKNEQDGSLIFRARVTGLNEILVWILGYGKEAEVLKPLELRDLVKQHVVELSRIYDTKEVE